MWLIVMFDMPTKTDVQRKRATRLRTGLAGLGFERLQFSVYCRRCPGLARTMENRVGRLKIGGDTSERVAVVQMTDDQFAAIQFVGARLDSAHKFGSLVVI